MYISLKRFFDIVFSVVLLIVLTPLLLFIILLLRFTAEGEVFYFQERVGFRNCTFRIWKFATMLKDSPNMLTGTLTLRNDPRVTSVGRWLRMTKINELPQLVNILRGEMSFIGPRPQVMSDFLAYPPHIQAVIYNIKPGVTGIGSVIFRDEEKLLSACNVDPHEFYRKYIAPYKGLLEIWYQEKASITTDAKIVFLTIWEIFFPDSRLAYSIFPDLPARPAILDIHRAMPTACKPAVQATIKNEELY